MNDKSKIVVKYGIAILIILIVAMAINNQLMTNWRNEYENAEYQYNHYKGSSGDSYIRGQMMTSYGNQMNELSSQIELSETIQGYMPIGMAAGIIVIVIGIILGIKDYSSLGKKEGIAKIEQQNIYTNTGNAKSPNINNMKLDIFCPSDWNNDSIKTVIETFCKNYVEGMTVEELEPNVLQGTLRKETIIQNICSKCGATLLEKAKLCDQCGAEKEINEYQKLLKNLPPDEYKGIFTIGMDANGGRFVQINYVAGDSNSKDYVEIFWNNLHKGLKSVLEQPFSSLKE